MRRFPLKPNQKQELIIQSVEDYFGETNPEEKKSATKIAFWLIGKREGIILTDEEKETKEIIKKNIAELNPPSKIDCSEFRPQFSLINLEVSPQRGSLGRLRTKTPHGAVLWAITTKALLRHYPSNKLKNCIKRKSENYEKDKNEEIIKEFSFHFTYSTR